MTTPSPMRRPAERRRLQQREDARRAILEATEDLLVELGTERFSIRRLVARCGYSAPTIYHHFGDKRGLIDTLIEERYRDVLERSPQLESGADPVETLRILTGYFVRFGLQNPDHYRLLTAYRPDDSPPPESAEKLKVLIEAPLRSLAEAGRLRASSLEEALQTLWVLVHGLTAMQINQPDEDWSPSLNDFALSAMLRGLVREPGEATPARPGGTDA